MKEVKTVAGLNPDQGVNIRKKHLKINRFKKNLQAKGVYLVTLSKRNSRLLKVVFNLKEQR